MVSLLILALLGAGAIALVWYLSGVMGTPQPWRSLITALVGVIVLLYLLQRLGLLNGVLAL